MGEPELIEAFCGEYASGKSENAIGRSVSLLESGHSVRLVDLDLAEPFYTLRPLKERLKGMGIDVIAADTKSSMGLGEAGTPLSREAVGSLHFGGRIVLDLGHGPRSARILRLLDWSGTDPALLRVYLVLNARRPLTSDVAGMVECINGFGASVALSGLINNTNLGRETTPDMVVDGLALVEEASRVTGVPVVATSVVDWLGLAGTEGLGGHPVWVVRGLMSGAYW